MNASKTKIVALFRELHTSSQLVTIAGIPIPVRKEDKLVP